MHDIDRITFSLVVVAEQEAELSFTGATRELVLGDPSDPATHNPLLRRYLIVTASDGYQVVFSGGELDPNFGNTPVYLAWAENGTPLTADEGPIRLVVPGDLRGGRYVRGVSGIEVLSISDPPS